jgi:subtilisin-like proprotein convertase family protein
VKRTFIIGLLLLACSWAHAGLYSETFNSGASVGTVAQGNPVGSAFTGSFNADPNSSAPVLGITVSLNVSGGYSGGFYMYLVGPDGLTTVTLLNTPGTSTSGLDITLQDGSPAITSGSNLSSGTYAAYGTLGNLDGQTADGTWTIYFADLSSGGGSPTLDSWSLGITAVPEPVNGALVIFGICVAGVGAVRFYLRRRHSATAR